MKNKWGIYFILTLTTVIWGSAFLAGSIATQELSPVTVAFLRFLIASAILFPIMWIREKNRPKILPIDYFMLGVLGLTGIFFL